VACSPQIPLELIVLIVPANGKAKYLGLETRSMESVSQDVAIRVVAKALIAVALAIFFLL
jgi:hypothetical protein